MTDLTLGNDYQEFSIQNQMELLFSIKTASFPLYAPGYARGHSSSALSLGGIFHPLPHIASILPGYWEGKALQWNTLLRLLSLGLTHLALFTFLRKINLNILFSFLFSLIAVYNMRMLDMFRYGASLETYTGFLLLCAAITWNSLKPTKCLGPLGIIGATYWLICSGHPTMMFYGLLGATLFLLVIPFFISAMLQNNQVNYKTALGLYIKIGFYIVLGILLSSAYIIPFYFDFMPMNPMRVALDYDPYTMETFFGTISNFFMPLFSDVHSSFGGSSIFLVAAILPVLLFFKVRIPKAVWVIWGLVLFTFLYMQAGRTPLHKWAWDYVPFVSSLRVAGRICLITPIFIMLVLAWVINAESYTLRLRKMTVTVAPYMLLALISFVLLSLYGLFSAAMQIGFIGNIELGVFPPKYINNLPLWKIGVVALSGAVSLLLLIFYSSFPNAGRVLGISLSVITCIQLAGVLHYGTFIAEKRKQPSFAQMKSQKKLKLDYLYNPGSGMYSSIILNQLSRSFLEPALGKIFTDVIPVSSQEDAYRKMNHQRLPQQVFVEMFSPTVSREINKGAIGMKEGMVELVYSSFNRLQFNVHSESPAIFGLSYPFTGHWKALVDGNEVTVYRANGAAHAVEIPKGKSLIEFRYWSPAAFWGIIISCLTFAAIGLYICFNTLNGVPRITAVLFVLIAGLGVAISWNHSLYTGDNLGTEYTWTYTPPGPKPNLAYGKKTSIDPLPVDTYHYVSSFYHTHRSEVVDGDKSSGSGFIINPGRNAALIIDLYQREEIDSIIIFESKKDPHVNSSHLTLYLSQDESQWEAVASVTSEINNQYPVRIDFEDLRTARYIKIKASEDSRLSLDEVEVYGK